MGVGDEEWCPAQPAAEDLRNMPPHIDTVGGHVFLTGDNSFPYNAHNPVNFSTC